MKLFDMPPIEIKEKCKDCINCQRWQCNSKYFFYCGAIKSNLTNNGLQKIKARQTACKLFESIN